MIWVCSPISIEKCSDGWRFEERNRIEHKTMMLSTSKIP